MQILIQPTENGVRAQTSAPWNIAVEAATESEAMKDIYARIAEQIRAGAKVIVVDEPVLRQDNPLLQLAKVSSETDEEYEQFRRAMDEYRRQRDADEAATEGA